MSDLLSSLVDRALDRAQVLQPRQPALFEPVAEAAFGQQSQFRSAAPIDEENRLVESETIAVPARPRSQSRAFRFSLPRPEPEETERADVEPRRPRLRPSVNIVEPVQIERDHREPAETQARTESASHPIIEEERSRQLPEAREKTQPEASSAAQPRMVETIIEKRVERETISEPAKATPAIKEDHALVPSATELRKQHREDEDRAEPIRVKSKQPAPAKDEPAIKPRTQPKLLPRPAVSPVIRAAAKTESARAIKNAPPPVVHVTIGRVEVRATPQAAARPTKPAPVRGPRMKLEDYLRSRGEGTKQK